MSLIKNTLIVWELSAIATNLRSRLICVLCARFGNIAKSRRMLSTIIFQMIGCFATNDQVTISCRIFKKQISVMLRKGNRADYFVFGEMVMGGYNIRDDVSGEIKEIHDGGANIGLFSLYAHARFPNASLFCYEPDEQNIVQLKLNISINNIQAVFVPKALWSKSANLFYHPGEAYTGFVGEAESAYPITCICPTISSDSWLKLDIEGAEYEVLPEIIKSGGGPCLISLEIHDFSRRGARLLNLLSESGYSWSETFSPDEECISFSAYKV